MVEAIRRDDTDKIKYVEFAFKSDSAVYEAELQKPRCEYHVYPADRTYMMNVLFPVATVAKGIATAPQFSVASFSSTDYSHAFSSLVTSGKPLFFKPPRGLAIALLT